MQRSSPTVSPAEAEPLNSRPSRVSVDNIDHRDRSNDENGFPPPSPSPSPSPSLASDSYTSRGSGGSVPICPSISRHQQRNLQIRQQGQGHSYRHRNYSRDSRVQRMWLWEILSITAATLALAAIVIILVLHRDHPLPKWPSAITINALIAVFTAIFKACLMMPIAECIGQLKWLWYQKARPLGHIEQWDLASRGPWGSLLLIVVLKTRDLAVLGAILTISAMAIDPFTQQIVQFYSCSTVAEGERATVPFSNNYTTELGSVSDNPQLDLQLQSAMYIGLLAPPANVSAALEFECRTGNCTFPSAEDGATFQSLGLESHCVDISSLVAFSTTTPLVEDFPIGHIATLPAYSAEMKLYGNAPGLPAEVMLSADISSTEYVDEPAAFLNKVSYLMTHPDHQAEPQHTYAFECEFYPAVQTYSANIENGVLLEQVLNTQRMDVWPSGLDTRALLTVGRTIRDSTWHECRGSTYPTDENDIPVYKVQHPESTTMWWPQDCVFWLPGQVTGGLSQAISSLLGATLSYNPSTKTIERGKPWSLNIYNNGTPTLDTVQAVMDGMTRSVTARLRQGNGISINAAPVYGKVWEMQTCVRVNWSWLGLPAGLLLLTIVFLFLTIFKTRSKHARVWKSSIFAVLFSGLDQEIEKAAGPVVSLEGMKAAADKATVRLEDTKEGFRLVSQA